MTRSVVGVTSFLAAVLFSVAMVLIPSGLGPSRADYYSFYAEAIRNGRLWVALEPNCPYDTIAFQGKCFMHWGIVPGLFRLFPWTDRLGSILGALVLTFYFLKIITRLTENASMKTLLPIALFVAFGTGTFTAALCGWVYGESLCLAHAFGMMGIYYSLGMYRHKDPIRPVLAGTAVALACLTRPSWFLFAVMSLLWALRGRVWGYVAPIAAGFLVQAAMNFSRFHSPFEFGVKYYRGHFVGTPDLRWTEGIYSLKAVIPNLMTYFFTGSPPMPRYSALTRFFHGNLYVEFPLGLFVTMPVLFVMLTKLKSGWVRERGVLVMCLLPMAILILLNTNEIYRYQFELWLPLLIILLPELLKDSRHWIVVATWGSAAVCLVINFINTFWALSRGWGML